VDTQGPKNLFLSCCPTHTQIYPPFLLLSLLSLLPKGHQIRARSLLVHLTSATNGSGGSGAARWQWLRFGSISRSFALSLDLSLLALFILRSVLAPPVRAEQQPTVCRCGGTLSPSPLSSSRGCVYWGWGFETLPSCSRA